MSIFDRFRKKPFFVVIINGVRMVERFESLADLPDILGEDTDYKIEPRWMTEKEFQSLNEFTGF